MYEITKITHEIYFMYECVYTFFLHYIILINKIILYLQQRVIHVHKSEYFFCDKHKTMYNNIVFINKIILHLQEQRVSFSQT